MAEIKAKKVIFKNRDGEYLLPMTAEKTGQQLFDTILKDHILTYEESKGLALQGTYVYKEAIAGSRYGYADFYNKVVEEYNQATNTETVNGITVKVHSNGHKFYDIADKTGIDNYFNTMGSAWMYGVDTENERIFLPRNNYFDQATGDVSEVGQGVGAGLPNITGGFTSTANSPNADTAAYGAFVGTTTKGVSPTGGGGSGSIDTFDASRSSSIYGNSDTVQPNAVKKLLYICVGNTTNYAGMTDVVNQGMDILEQVNQGIESRVNLDVTNLSVDGKSLISKYAMVSDRYIDLTLGASGSTYTAPANGWFIINKLAGSDWYYCALTNNNTGEHDFRADYRTSPCTPRVYARRGDVIKAEYNATGTLTYFRFYYAEGNK